MPITHSHVVIGPVHGSPLPTTPALLHSTCAAPKRSSVACASACTLASSDVSHTTGSTSVPPSASSASTARMRTSSTSASTTFIPSAANAVASARPMPLAPPVTTATFPRSSCTRQRYATEGSAHRLGVVDRAPALRMQTDGHRVVTRRVGIGVPRAEVGTQVSSRHRQDVVMLLHDVDRSLDTHVLVRRLLV